MRTTSAKPLARSEDLVIEELEDEVLVFDSKRKRAHCLGATAARVWRACDGNSDASALSDTLDLSVDVVTQALDELDGLELLESDGLDLVQSAGGNGHANGNGMTRRQFSRKSAAVGAAVAAAPMVLSVNVNSAFALTPTPFVCSLFTSQSCGTSTSCGRTAGCCCCCQGGGSCKICGSESFCNAGKQNCGGTEIGTHCSSVGTRPADDRGCCGFTGSQDCGCGFGPGGGCCDRNTHAACTPSDSNPDCVPCCNNTPIKEGSLPGCCSSTTGTGTCVV